MPGKPKSSPAKASRDTAAGTPLTDVKSVLASLKRLSKPHIRKEMSSRYGIITKDAFGVRMNDMQLAKQLGRNHALALALWDTGNYEARTVAAFVAEPARLTPALMDRWCRDFDNWAICDTVCFKLFDQSPHALDRVVAWAERRDEFQKRAAFVLLACVALHDDNASDETIADCLPLIERAATEERNFVKKGVSWALRSVAGRNAKLKAAAIALARRLAASPEAAPCWVGKDVLRALTLPKHQPSDIMTAEEFRAAARKAVGAIESSHMNHPDFRVKGKIFASLGYPDDGWGMVKLTPEQQRAFMKEAPETFALLHRRMGKAGRHQLFIWHRLRNGS